MNAQTKMVCKSFNLGLYYPGATTNVFCGENTGFAVPVCGIQPNLASVSDLRNPPLNLLLRKMRRVFFDRLCWLIDFRLISAENPDSVTT